MVCFINFRYFNF